MSDYNSNDNVFPPEPPRSWRPTPPPAPGCGPQYERYDRGMRYREPMRGGWHGAQPERNGSNGFGVAGLVLSIVTTMLWWIPYFGGTLWLLAIIFSAIGMGRKPRGMAVAGLLISVVLPLLFLLAVVAFGISIAFLDMHGM